MADKKPAKKVAKKALAKKAVASAKPTPSSKTKTIIKSGTTGEIVSKEAAKKDPAGTMAVTVATDSQPGFNQTAAKREAKKAKAAKKTAVKKAVTKAPAAKKAVKKAAAKKIVKGDPSKAPWREKTPKPVQAFGKSYPSVEAAALDTHRPVQTIESQAASKDGEFAHVSYGNKKKAKK